MTFLSEDGHASILPLKIQHLVPCEGRYPELLWMLLVRSNVPNAAQGLVKMCPCLYIIHCDGRGRTSLSLGSALGYAWNLDAGLSV